MTKTICKSCGQATYIQKRNHESWRHECGHGFWVAPVFGEPTRLELQDSSTLLAVQEVAGESRG